MNRKYLSLICTFCFILLVRSQTCTDPGCHFCSEDTLICKLCYEGYILTSSSTCQYSSQICAYDSKGPCLFSYCLKQDVVYTQYRTYPVCTSCVHPYESDSFRCVYYCNITEEYVSDIKDCKPICQVNNCDVCSQTVSDLCDSCSSGYHLYNGKCVNSCPPSTYLESSINECLPCMIECLSCVSDNDCTACHNPYQIPLLGCKCSSGQVLSDGICSDSCKYNFQPVDQVCESKCSNGKFPVYFTNSVNFECQEVTTSSSDYCTQNLADLMQLISVSLSPDGTMNYLLTVRFEQTSLICYSIYLRVGGKNLQSISEEIFETYSEAVFFLNGVDFQNPQKNNCSYYNCYIYLSISWKDYAAYWISIQIKTNLSGQLINSISYYSAVQEGNIVCENCEIPSNQIIGSQVEVICPSNHHCTNDSINTLTSNSIIITQTISEIILRNSLVFPHSLKLSYYDRLTGYNVDAYIKNYNYTNSALGQITYTFYANPMQNATLTVTSFVKSTVGNQRMLSSSSTSVNYPQTLIHITIEEDSSSVKGQEPSQTEIIVITTVIACILVSISIARYFAYKKKQQHFEAPELKQDSEDFKKNQELSDLEKSEKRELKQKLNEDSIQSQQ